MSIVIFYIVVIVITLYYTKVICCNSLVIIIALYCINIIVNHIITYLNIIQIVIKYLMQCIIGLIPCI